MKENDKCKRGWRVVLIVLICATILMLIAVTQYSLPRSHEVIEDKTEPEAQIDFDIREDNKTKMEVKNGR